MLATVLTRELEVSRATVCRDVQALLRMTNEGKLCPCCGSIVRWFGDLDVVKLARALRQRDARQQPSALDSELGQCLLEFGHSARGYQRLSVSPIVGEIETTQGGKPIEMRQPRIGHEGAADPEFLELWKALQEWQAGLGDLRAVEKERAEIAERGQIGEARISGISQRDC
ncbi:MAG: hypothetical protein HY329_09755 [Chloroflexi bacterium]|nr:hypothetical protein [Chloroflexota bacterium]